MTRSPVRGTVAELIYFTLMVVIRLARFGKKSHPTFRVIVSDKQKDTKGTYLEQLGTYNPHTQPAALDLKEDRVKYWLSVGAQPSDTVHNLLVEKGLIQADKRVIVKAKPAAPAEGEAAPASETPTPAEPKAETSAPEASPEKAAVESEKSA